MQKDKAAPLKIHHYLGWIILTIVLIPLIGFSLILHVRENREIVGRSTLWKDNWPQLKIGMTKEQVLAVVGAPHSTTVIEMKTENVTTDPPDEKIEQDVREKLALLDNYAIWSYRNPIVIHTHPGEDMKTAENEGEIQLKEIVESSGDGKLHGHSIKFDPEGRVIEISP